MTDVEKIRVWLDGCTGFHCEACMDERPSECHGSRDGMIVEKMCRILLDACEKLALDKDIPCDDFGELICGNKLLGDVASDAVSKCAKVIE